MSGKQLLLCHAGKFGYYLTFVLQWLNLLCANVGLVVLCGQSLKVIPPWQAMNVLLQIMQTLFHSSFSPRGCCSPPFS